MPPGLLLLFLLTPGGKEERNLLVLPEKPVPIHTWLRRVGWRVQRGDPRRWIVGRRELLLVSRGDSVAIGTRRGFPLNPERWPRLEMVFRVLELPRGTNLRAKKGDDAAFRVYVAFDRGRGLLGLRPPHTVAYTWTEKDPPGTVIRSPHFSTVRYLSLGRGLPAGKAPPPWQRVVRDLRADYRRCFPEAKGPVPPIVGLLLKCDSNNTGTSARAAVQRLRFLGPAPSPHRPGGAKEVGSSTERKDTMLRVLLLPALLAALAGAQMPEPAPQLDRLNPLLGNWTGKGTSRMGADAEPRPWTSLSTVKRILGGHFVQEDTRIDLGMPQPMIFRTIYFWDAERKRLRFFSMGNMGSAGTGDVLFADDSTMVGGQTRLEQGRPVTERWVVRVHGDTQDLRIERAEGGGPFYVQVEGQIKRGGEGFVATPETAGQALMSKPHPSLKGWHKMLGRWRVEGKASPMPGMPLESFSGEEEVFLLFGGHVVAARISGKGAEGPAYEGWSYLAFDQERNCLVNFGLSNMGFAHVTPCYPGEGDRFLFVAAQRFAGNAMAWRMVFEPAGEEGVYRAWADRLAGTAKPERSFEAVYRKVASD